MIPHTVGLQPIFSTG